MWSVCLLVCSHLFSLPDVLFREIAVAEGCGSVRFDCSGESGTTCEAWDMDMGGGDTDR